MSTNHPAYKILAILVIIGLLSATILQLPALLR